MNNPDSEIEEFWLSFKKSMNNFYEENINLQRPIHYWSNVLNGYKETKNYEKIEEHIKKYISLYAIDLLRTNNSYNINILISNIARWNKLSNKYAFSIKQKSYCNFIFVLLDIYKSLVRHSLNNREQEEINETFGQFDLMLLYQDYSPLIVFSVKYNKPNILDKLFDFDKDIYTNVIETYELNVSDISIMKGYKLLKLVKNKINNIFIVY